MANAWILRPLPIAAASANRTTLGAPLNVATDYAGIIWQTTAADAKEQLILDLGSNQIIDTLMLFGIVTPSTPTMDVSAALDGDAGFSNPVYQSTPQAVLAGAVLPVSGKGVAIWQSTATITARYVRISFYGFAAGTDTLTISRAVVGKRIQLSRNFSYGAAFGVRDLGSLDFSRRGVLLRVRGAKLRTCQLTFSNIRKDEVEASTKPLLEQIGNTETIAFVTDPTPDPQRQNRCYFGPLVGDLSHTWRNAAAWEAKANVVSLF